MVVIIFGYQGSFGIIRGHHFVCISDLILTLSVLITTIVKVIWIITMIPDSNSSGRDLSNKYQHAYPKISGSREKKYIHVVQVDSFPRWALGAHAEESCQLSLKLSTERVNHPCQCETLYLQLDKARIAASKSSPMMETINLVSVFLPTPHIQQPIFHCNFWEISMLYHNMKPTASYYDIALICLSRFWSVNQAQSSSAKTKSEAWGLSTAGLCLIHWPKPRKAYQCLF